MIQSIFKEVLTLKDLKNQFITSPLQTNKYRLIITPPAKFNELLLSYKLAVLSKSFAMPKREVKTKKISFHGRPVYVRSQLEFQESLTVSVYDDSNMNLRKILERWLSSVDDINNSEKEYKGGNIKLYQLDSDNNEIYGVNFNDVFITSLGDITYSADSHDIITYDITFSYTTFESLLN